MMSFPIGSHADKLDGENASPTGLPNEASQSFCNSMGPKPDELFRFLIVDSGVADMVSSSAGLIDSRMLALLLWFEIDI
jgi:hypothetical protein